VPIRQFTREEAHSVLAHPEEMKKCIWLKPELVAQIEFTEWTPDGHLRHSKFVGCGMIKTRFSWSGSNHASSISP
jgi:ATP-dependent DNA ligase